MIDLPPAGTSRCDIGAGGDPSCCLAGPGRLAIMSAYRSALELIPAKSAPRLFI
jgi:hypothetical protein